MSAVREPPPPLSQRKRQPAQTTLAKQIDLPVTQLQLPNTAGYASGSQSARTASTAPPPGRRPRAPPRPRVHVHEEPALSSARAVPAHHHQHKTDSGLRAAKASVWDAQAKPTAFTIPLSAIAAAPTEEKSASGAATERVLIGRSEAIKRELAKITQPHTAFIRAPPAATSENSAATAAHSVSFAAGPAAISASASVSSLVSPRRARLLSEHKQQQQQSPSDSLVHSASASLFTNSHHFLPLAVPSPPQPLKVPIVMLTAAAAAAEAPAASVGSARSAHEQSQQSLAPSGSATQLVYESETSTARLLPADSMSSLHPSASFASLQPSASAVSLQRYGDAATAAAPASYFSSPAVQSISNLHVPAPHPLLAVSSSLGALPYGMTVSESYATLDNQPRGSGSRKPHPQTHVQSSPSMPRFGGASVHASTAALSAAQSAAALYPAELTVDNSALVQRRLRELIRENGYSYRASSNNVLHGELGDSSDELSDSEKRRYRSTAATAAKQRRSDSRKLIHSKTSKAPKPSWHQAGVESVAASAQAFPALFGLVDAGSALRKRKRAERLEGERARAAAHQEAARLDGTRAVTAVPTNDDDAATSTPLSPRNVGDEKSGGPPSLLRRSSNVLVPLDLATKAVSTAVLAPVGMSALIADPLQPRGPAGSKPSLIGAAVRVLLRRELHPTTQDANAVGVRQLDRVAARDAAAAFAVKKEKKLGLMDVVAASAFGEGELTADADQPEPDQSAYGSTALARVYNSDAIAIAPKGSAAASTTALARAFNSASHSHAHAAAVAQRGAKKAQRVSMEKWLELRLKKHKKVLKEEDRLRARELFDMIASSSASADRRKEDGTLMRIGERERDPLQATVELEGMRRALKGLGMDSSCEELAFRLQKLSEYHRNVRAAAASGLVVPGSHTSGSKSARTVGVDGGPKLSSRKGAPALSSVGTVSQTGELRLAFNDFLAVYDHISNWDELLQLRHLKRHKAEQQRAMEASQAKRERRRRAGVSTGEESSGTESDANSPPRRPAAAAAAHRHAASTSSLASPNSGSLRALHAQHQKQLGSPSAPATSESSAAAGAASGSRPMIPPLALDTALTASSSMASLASRTDDTLRRVDLPFFLWVPAHHRSKKINDLITMYGLPSTVGVGVGLEDKEKDAGSKQSSPRKTHAVRTGSKKDMRQPRSSRTHRKTAASSAAADSGSDSDAAAASAKHDRDRDGSSSSEEDLSAPGRATPVAIERHLVDELHPTKLPALAASASASPVSSPRSPLRSPGGSSRPRRPSAAISSPGKKTTAGEYWGSQQVMRALHFKNLTLSSSTMQKQTVLTHETIAPGALLSPLNSGHHRTLSGSPPAAAASPSPSSLVRRPTSRGVITPLPAGKRSLAPTPIPSVPEEPFVPVPKFSVDLATAADKPSAAPFVPSPSKVPELSDVAQRVAEEAERTAQEVARFVEEVRLNMQRAQAAEMAAEEQRAQEEARAKAEEEAKQAQVDLSPEQSAAKESSKAKEAEAAKDAAAKDAAIQAALTLHAHVSHGEGRARLKKKTTTAVVIPSKSVSPVATARARASQKAATAAPVAATAIVPFNSTSAARAAVVQRDKDLEVAAAKEAAAAAAEAARSEVMALTDPMIKAAKTGAWEDVLMLIQTSAGDSVRERAHYVNRKDKNGSSAIFHCVWLGHFRVLEVLLYHGADPNVQNNRLNTALHLCCEKGHRRLIKLLIEMGAAIDLRNWQAKTCLDVIPLEEEVSLANAVQSNTALVTAAPTTVKVASEAADSLKAFVLECAADAKRKRDKEREESGGLGMVSSTLSLMRGAGGAADQSFSEMNSKRDAASAAALAAMEAKPLTLYDATGKPLLDLFELTAEDRRSAGIRGNFFGSDRISSSGSHSGSGGVAQSRTLSGQILIHSAAHLSASASANAMGSYKAQYAQATSATGAAAAETRAKLVSALVREELAHHSLSSLWGKTRAAVGARQTVVASSDDLLASQESSRMEHLRAAMAHSEQGIEAAGGSRAARVEHIVQPAEQQHAQEERRIFRSETKIEAQNTITEE